MPTRPSITARARAHLSDPLHRNGYALVAASAITSVLGMGFWVLAAHLYSPAQLGTGSALIAAMGFLANASTLGLRNGFIRFLPDAGLDKGRFIRNGYLLCVAVAMVFAVGFVLGQPLWADELDLFRGSPWPTVALVVATAAWTVFVLQDSVLTGLRLATWVPVENTIFSVAKLLLLVLLTSLTTWGVFLAWAAPPLALIVPVNILIARRLRRHRASAPTNRQGIGMGPVLRFAAGDHAAALLWLATTELIPMVVLVRSGAAASAFYFLSFNIAYSLYLVTSNVASAFLVEAATYPDRETALVHRALKQTSRLVVPVALLGAVFAPFLLMLIGKDYQENGATLLRLLLLSSIPQMFTGLSLARARLRRRIGVVIVVYAAIALSLFSGAVLSSEHGLASLGWIWLATQTVIALLLVPTMLPSLVSCSLDRAILHGASLRTTMRERIDGRAGSALVASALPADCQPSVGGFTMLRSSHNVAVATATLDGCPVVVRVATGVEGAQSVRRHQAMLRLLNRDPPLGAWGLTVPELLRHGVTDGRPYVIETRLPGTSADKVSPGDRASATAKASTAIGELHRLTAYPTVLDDQQLTALVDEPISVLHDLRGLRRRHRSGLDLLGRWLRESLLGREVELSCTHGDLWAGNLLIEPRAVDEGPLGIIDWENASFDGLPEVDAALLWLNEQPGELGDAVLTAARHPEDWPATSTLENGSVVVGTAALPARAILLLAWLKHVSDGVRRERRTSTLWVRRNVTSVLDTAYELTRDAAETR